MKYKVLINGRSTLVTDLIQHTEAYFDMLSTSDCWQDLLGHFKMFEPDAYVCFVDMDFEKSINQIRNLKTSGFYNGAVIVFIGEANACDAIEEKGKFMYDVLIRRPFTPDNFVLRITRYFEDMSEARERAKARKLELQAQEEAKKAALEAKAAEAVEKEEQSAEPAVGEKKHILIVDDDRTILKMLKSALGEQYEVTTMINGVMVDKLLDTKKVDLIILDYEMPIETGADIFRRLKKNPKAEHIPVCFLTGVSEREKIMEVMSLKPHGYLLKPIDMDMLRSTIKNLTD